MAYQPAVICKDCKHQLGCCIWFVRKWYDCENNFLWGFQEERWLPFILLSLSLLINKNRWKWQLSLWCDLVNVLDNEHIQSFQQPFWCLYDWDYCSGLHNFKKCFAHCLHLWQISSCLGMTTQYLPTFTPAASLPQVLVTNCIYMWISKTSPLQRPWETTYSRKIKSNNDAKMLSTSFWNRQQIMSSLLPYISS